MDKLLEKAKSILEKAVKDGKIKIYSLNNLELKSGMKLRNPDIPDFLITSNLTISRLDGAKSMQPFFLSRGDNKVDVEKKYILKIEEEIKQYYK